MNLEQLRERYKEAKTEEERDKIKAVAEAYKLNPVYRSVEMGGNGYCYECFLNKARPDHYNCDKCAGRVPTNGRPRSLTELSMSLKEKIKNNSKKIQDAETEHHVNESFGV